MFLCLHNIVICYERLRKFKNVRVDCIFASGVRLFKHLVRSAEILSGLIASLIHRPIFATDSLQLCANILNSVFFFLEFNFKTLITVLEICISTL